MPRRIVVIDTSILCCFVQVPGKETAGSGKDAWNYDRAKAFLELEIKKGSTLVLPVATLIETGNHISQASSGRHESAKRLCTHILATADAKSPWAAFTEQADLWNSESLRRLSTEWPALANNRLSMGDATIKDVADYYKRAGWEVEILTSDGSLKSYQPAIESTPPRRRS